MTTEKHEMMIDIETLDVTPDAVVFQVGACIFDKQHMIVESELWNLTIDEQIADGREISASTLAFHLGIPENLKAALEDPNTVRVETMIGGLVGLFHGYHIGNVWSKGRFDFDILGSMFEWRNHKLPWKFYQERELRTLMSECRVSKGDVSHNALEDCIAQIGQLADAREKISFRD